MRLSAANLLAPAGFVNPADIVNHGPAADLCAATSSFTADNPAHRWPGPIPVVLPIVQPVAPVVDPALVDGRSPALWCVSSFMATSLTQRSGSNVVNHRQERQAARSNLQRATPDIAVVVNLAIATCVVQLRDTRLTPISASAAAAGGNVSIARCVDAMAQR